MSVVRPFRGVRPVKQKVHLVASRPYDVLSSSEARAEAKGNPFSFLHVVKPEIDFPDSVDVYDDVVYQKGRENLYKMMDEGVLLRDKKPCFYLYRLVWKDVSQIGIVATTSVEDYENNVIKKHEKTRQEKEADRVKHVATQNANAGPIFLTYRQSERIDKITKQQIQKEPLYDFTCGDGVQHTLWLIDKQVTIKSISTIFKDIPCLYVADGHHRSASAAIVGARKRAANPNHTGKENYNYFLSVLFPHNQLFIMDYNRIVKDLNNLKQSEFLEKLSDDFSIEKLDEQKAPKGVHCFSMYLGGAWYSLVAKQKIIAQTDSVNCLDTSILQERVLDKLLGIKDPTKDKRLDFVGGIRGLEELSKRVDAGEAVAFALFPTSIQQLMAIADENKIMPPKSTWFEPKLRSGIIVNLLD